MPMAEYTIACPKCGTVNPVAADHTFCFECGTPLRTSQRPAKAPNKPVRMLTCVTLILVVGIVGCLIVAFSAGVGRFGQYWSSLNVVTAVVVTPPPPTLQYSRPDTEPAPLPGIVSTSTEIPTEVTLQSSPSETEPAPSPKPIYSWYQGDPRNHYELLPSPNSFRVTAASSTDMNGGVKTAPLIVYAKSGDFDARVKVVASPSVPCQFAGMGVRPTHSADAWLRIGRQSCGANNQLVTTLDNQDQSRLGFGENDVVSYSFTTVYLRIQRTGQLFTLSYSRNGSDWQIIANKYALPMEEHVDIFLVTLSHNGSESLTADFYDFALR
jgi:regulation of enolase protein 1 (concanavalin A-like superfamily)